MLSVIKVWAQAVYDMKNKSHDFDSFFHSALLKAREALNNTLIK